MPRIRPETPPFDQELAEQINSDGMVTVECPACGDYYTIEPDADYPCPCEEGQLVSPLRLWGII